MLDAVVSRFGARPDEWYFWAAHSGTKLDLVVIRERQRLGFAFKRTTTPTVTRSMHTAPEDLRLSRRDVVHAGARSGERATGIRAVALERLLGDLTSLP